MARYDIVEEDDKRMGSAEKYLSQEQVKDYNNQLLAAIRNNKCLQLGPMDVVEKQIDEYFTLCDETNQLPSIKALALYLGVTKRTLDKYMYDPLSPYYNMLNLARDMCHVVIENGAMNNKVNPATYMFTAANYYDMKNTQSVELNHNNSEAVKELAKAEDSLKALKQVISLSGISASGDIKDAEYVELEKSVSRET